MEQANCKICVALGPLRSATVKCSHTEEFGNYCQKHKASFAMSKVFIHSHVPYVFPFFVTHPGQFLDERSSSNKNQLGMA